MKTDRKFFILVESLLAAAAVVIGAILVIGPAEDNHKTVSFIVEDVDDESNSALLYGMKQAASDNDVNLKILSSDKLRDSDTFSELLSQAKAKGTSCYIIEPSMKGDLNQSIMDLYLRITAFRCHRLITMRWGHRWRKRSKRISKDSSLRKRLAF